MSNLKQLFFNHPIMDMPSSSRSAPKEDGEGEHERKPPDRCPDFGAGRHARNAHPPHPDKPGERESQGERAEICKH